MRLFYSILILIVTSLSCNSQQNNMSERNPEHRYTNSLVNETSPYLLQHAHNPVNWYPWNEQTLAKALKEDKLLLISIGYSACHWCHVMEHESFEDEEVAKIMNDNFICIKIDREERPDIDQIYMTAVQLMNQRGGWPLNCIALPDGRPFWGGTYFRKEDWKKQILSLSNIYKNNRNSVLEFAEKLSQGIEQVEMIVKNPIEKPFVFNDLDKMIAKWSKSFDNKEGGSNGAPKFPMPNAYSFLLHYGHLANNQAVLDHVELTLNKMAFGGIYDQIGGGFSRYSVDKFWKAPHFEKMLYDNAQLVSLYSEGYLKFKNPIYREVVFESLDFIERELLDQTGAFYSALDADSEGEEGKFYVWSKAELESLIKEDFEIFKDYYNINQKGLWEHGRYILLKKESKEEVASKHNIKIKELEDKVANWKRILMSIRDKRIRPGLDDKSLTSWNALMLKGYIDAYMAFGEKRHLEIAIRNANFILTNQLNKDGRLWHSYKKGVSTINGFLEDYALVISAYIRLYEATFDDQWLSRSESMMKYVMSHFYDESSSMFFFTSDLDPKLVARKMEVNDNVIPASNSVIANALYDLGTVLDNKDYKKLALNILNNVKPNMDSYVSGYANYANLMLKVTKPYYEIAIIGDEALEKSLEINNFFYSNKILVGSLKESSSPLLEGKYISGETMIYVCEDKVCQKPTNSITEACKLLE